MKTSTITLALVGMTFALTACNRPDTNRTTSIPTGVDRVATVQDAPTGLSAPPAPPERGPVPPDANAAAPGTNASAALANEPTLKDATLPKDTGDSANDQRVAVQAQDAAAKAPDTASADAAKNAVMGSNATGMSGTARDTEANNPRSGTLTKEEEVNQMPKAGQGDNHSSTSLEKDSGR